MQGNRSDKFLQRSLPEWSTKNNTLFQVISDNFNTEVSSQNGKSQTYCLAIIITKTPNLREDLPHTTFRQLKKEEMTVPIGYIYEA